MLLLSCNNYVYHFILNRKNLKLFLKTINASIVSDKKKYFESYISNKFFLVDKFPTI